jgi:Flp pilus assembly protein TadD
MKCSGWLIAALAVLAGAPPALAHPPWGPHGHGGLSFGKFRKGGHLSFSLGRPYAGYYAPPLYNPFGRSTSFTQIYLYSPPPVIVPPVPDWLGMDRIDPSLLLPRRPPPDEAEDLPPPPPPERPPGREAGKFRPLDPDNRDRARRPVRPEPEPEPEQPPRPRLPRDDDPVPPPRPRAPVPDPDQRRESQRQVELGKEAFADGEYGLAAERFRRAADTAPNDPLPHFLLAQAQVALGNYRRAFDAIQDGLRLRPDWPAQPFRPLELYGDNAAAYAAHLTALGDTLAANPDDAVLLFLHAYLLWFDGRKAEARPLFERARPALPDPTVVERFLQALPGGPAV